MAVHRSLVSLLISYAYLSSQHTHSPTKQASKQSGKEAFQPWHKLFLILIPYITSFTQPPPSLKPANFNFSLVFLHTFTKKLCVCSFIYGTLSIYVRIRSSQGIYGWVGWDGWRRKKRARSQLLIRKFSFAYLLVMLSLRMCVPSSFFFYTFSTYPSSMSFLF